MKIPPTYSSGPPPESYAPIAVTPPAPLPKADQIEPFHLAIPLAWIPPMVEKKPPA